jgi:hypothetical protein
LTRLAPLAAFALVVAAQPSGATAARSPCGSQVVSSQQIPLTPAQCIAASKLVAADAYLRALLHGRTYTVSSPDPWGNQNGTRNIGAVLHIHLAKRLTVARTEIPVADFPADQSNAFTMGHEAVSIHGATGLTVFVDFSRHRVVWVMPTPDASVGPPPTSVRPNTPPPGFVLGTGGATPSEAAQGLLMHSVTFDDTGRLVQEEWADPVSGRAVTNVYNADRKLAASFVSVLTGHTIRVTTITYSAHTWTTGTGPIPADPSQVLALDSRSLPDRLRALTANGHEPVHGIDTIRLDGTTGIAYWGLLFVAGGGSFWVDPSTYLPVEETVGDPGTRRVGERSFFSWVPRTAAAGAATTRTPPASYKRTRSTGLPHIFGD